MTACDFCYFDDELSVRWNYRDPEAGYRRRAPRLDGSFPTTERVGWYHGSEISLPPRSLERLRTLLISVEYLGALAATTTARIDQARKPIVETIFADLERQFVNVAHKVTDRHILESTLLDWETPPSAGHVPAAIATKHQPTKNRHQHAALLAAYADRRWEVAHALAPLEWSKYPNQRRFERAVDARMPAGEAYDVYRPLPLIVAARSRATLVCDTCRNDIWVCHECAYHERHICSECGDTFCASCLQWSDLATMQLEKRCDSCASRSASTIVPVASELEKLLERADRLVTRCDQSPRLFHVLKKGAPRILVVSDGVHFDYSTRLATLKLASRDVFVVGTQFDYTGWPTNRVRPPRDRFTIWEQSFDVTQQRHWEDIVAAFGPFDAILFNNPLIGYYFHRIHAKGSNSKFETWEAIHSLSDAPCPYAPSRIDNCFCAREHARDDGSLYDFTKAEESTGATAFAWEDVYAPLVAEESDFRRRYHAPPSRYQGRTFAYNVEYARRETRVTRGFQWFILAAYHEFGRRTLASGGTIEVNAPGVLDETLTAIGFQSSGGFRAGPYGQDFAVELTHYGWHPSWPMFDRMEMESGPQDGDPRDMVRYVAK